MFNFKLKLHANEPYFSLIFLHKLIIFHFEDFLFYLDSQYMNNPISIEKIFHEQMEKKHGICGIRDLTCSCNKTTVLVCKSTFYLTF